MDSFEILPHDSLLSIPENNLLVILELIQTSFSMPQYKGIAKPRATIIIQINIRKFGFVSVIFPCNQLYCYLYFQHSGTSYSSPNYQHEKANVKEGRIYPIQNWTNSNLNSRSNSPSSESHKCQIQSWVAYRQSELKFLSQNHFNQLINLNQLNTKQEYNNINYNFTSWSQSEAARRRPQQKNQEKEKQKRGKE